jgi:hypothetical protein
VVDDGGSSSMSRNEEAMLISEVRGRCEASLTSWLWGCFFANEEGAGGEASLTLKLCETRSEDR